MQDIDGFRGEDDGEMERRGDAELVCESGEIVLDLVEEVRFVSSSMSDFSSRSNFLSRSEFSLL